jgi:hypothetical protein
MMKKMIFAVAAASAMTGCNAGRDTAVAEAEVARFHQMLDAGQYHEIYQATGSEFRNATSEEQLTGILAMVHDRLGRVQQATREGWHFNTTNGTTRVQLNYNTRFATAPGTEQFVYTINNGAASLVSYDVHSDALRSSGATANPGAKPGDPAPDQAEAATDTGGTGGK